MNDEERARECWIKYNSGNTDNKREDLVQIIAKAFRAVREEAYEDAARIAENSLMDKFLPRHTAVRAFIAATIRARGKK